MIQNDFNHLVLKIWETHNLEHTQLVPQFYDTFDKNKTLFVGLNPLFSEKGYKSFLRQSIYSHWLNDLKTQFSINYFRKNPNLAAEYIEIEKLSMQNYSYYKTFNRISQNWNYVDLFHIRVTEQAKMKSLYSADSDFFKAQFELTLSLIKELQPEIVIVVNAFASNLINKATSPTFNDNWGTFQLFDRPIFFSGMLSGVGAIDKGAFRRLQWHYNFVKSKI